MANPARPAAKPIGRTMTAIEQLTALGACPLAIDWVEGQTDQDPLALWIACEQPDWMLRYLSECGVEIRTWVCVNVLPLALRAAARTAAAAGLDDKALLSAADGCECGGSDAATTEAADAAEAAEAAAHDAAEAAEAAAAAAAYYAAAAATTYAVARSDARALLCDRIRMTWPTPPECPDR